MFLIISYIASGDREGRALKIDPVDQFSEEPDCNAGPYSGTRN